MPFSYLVSEFLDRNIQIDTVGCLDSRVVHRGWLLLEAHEIGAAEKGRVLAATLRIFHCFCPRPDGHYMFNLQTYNIRPWGAEDIMFQVNTEGRLICPKTSFYRVLASDMYGAWVLSIGFACII